MALLGALAIAGCSRTPPAAEDAVHRPIAKHVVLIAWDGMRPDFITKKTTPVLYELASRGAFFANHHSVYVTSTEVNGTAIATGCYPNHNGILANREYRPDIHLTHPIGTEDMASMRIGDALSDGRYIRTPTVAETVRAAGFPTIIAGTKPVAAIHDRKFERDDALAQKSIVLYAGAVLPEQALGTIQSALGKFPEPPAKPLVPNVAQNEWTTRALTEVLWKDGVPKFSLLWLSDPDYTQHQAGPGSDAALEAIRADDKNLGKVLAALKAKGVRDETDVFIVSDHGFSTVDRTIDLTVLLRKAGFNVVRFFRRTPQSGEILLVNLGGSATFYVIGHDPELIRRLVDFLQAGDFAGPIFTRDAMPGTFSLHDARLDTDDAPDILFSYRWTDAKNHFGTPGSFVSESVQGYGPGFGTHASLSPFDFHNTLVAAGPDIRRGFRDELPSANVDVAPTIIHLLGIPQLQPMDGRVLNEALTGNTEALQPETSFKEASRELTGATWRQYLKFTKVGDRVYLDQGNVGAAPR